MHPLERLELTLIIVGLAAIPTATLFGLACLIGWLLGAA